MTVSEQRRPRGLRVGDVRIAESPSSTSLKSNSFMIVTAVASDFAVVTHITFFTGRRGPHPPYFLTEPAPAFEKWTKLVSP